MWFTHFNSKYGIKTKERDGELFGMKMCRMVKREGFRERERERRGRGRTEGRERERNQMAVISHEL